MGAGAKNVLWAQCEKCEKWRKLPRGTVVDPKKSWFCYMSTDKRRNHCAVPEESYDAEDDVDVDISSGDESQPRAGAKKKQSGKLTSKGKAGGHGGGASSSGHKNGLYGHAPSAASRAADANRKRSAAESGLRGSGSGTWAGKGGLPPVPPRPVPPAPRPGPGPGTSGGMGGGRPLPAVAGPPLLPPPSADEVEPGVEGLKCVVPLKGRGVAKARKSHGGFQKLLSSGGLWSIAKGRGRTVTAPPLWMWEGLATFAPQCALLAAEGADLASAARYFEVATPEGKAQAVEAITLGRLSMTLTSAVAAQECERVPGVLDDVPGLIMGPPRGAPLPKDQRAFVLPTYTPVPPGSGPLNALPAVKPDPQAAVNSGPGVSQGLWAPPAATGAQSLTSGAAPLSTAQENPSGYNGGAQPMLPPRMGAPHGVVPYQMTYPAQQGAASAQGVVQQGQPHGQAHGSYTTASNPHAYPPQRPQTPAAPANLGGPPAGGYAQQAPQHPQAAYPAQPHAPPQPTAYPGQPPGARPASSYPTASGTGGYAYPTPSTAPAPSVTYPTYGAGAAPLGQPGGQAGQAPPTGSYGGPAAPHAPQQYPTVGSWRQQTYAPPHTAATLAASLPPSSPAAPGVRPYAVPTSASLPQGMQPQPSFPQGGGGGAPAQPPQQQYAHAARAIYPYAYPPGTNPLASLLAPMTPMLAGMGNFGYALQQLAAGAFPQRPPQGAPGWPSPAAPLPRPPPQAGWSGAPPTGSGSSPTPVAPSNAAQAAPGWAALTSMTSSGMGSGYGGGGASGGPPPATASQAVPLGDRPMGTASGVALLQSAGGPGPGPPPPAANQSSQGGGCATIAGGPSSGGLAGGAPSPSTVTGPGMTGPPAVHAQSGQA